MSTKQANKDTDGAQALGLRVPTRGETVNYKPVSTDAIHFRNWKDNEDGLPAIVVKVWNATCVNLRVFDDGPTVAWKTSVVQGDEPGQWNWPKK